MVLKHEEKCALPKTIVTQLYSPQYQTKIHGIIQFGSFLDGNCL